MVALEYKQILNTIVMKRENMGKSPYSTGNVYRVTLTKGNVSIEFNQYAGTPANNSKYEIIDQLFRDVSTVNCTKNFDDWYLMFTDASNSDEKYYKNSKATYEELKTISKKLHVLLTDYEFLVIKEKVLR